MTCAEPLRDPSFPSQELEPVMGQEHEGGYSQIHLTWLTEIITYIAEHIVLQGKERKPVICSTTSPNNLANDVELKDTIFYYFLGRSMLCIFFNGVFLEKEVYELLCDSVACDFTLDIPPLLI